MLEAYAESPEPLSTLVLVAADINRTLRVVKALLKQAVRASSAGGSRTRRSCAALRSTRRSSAPGRYVVAGAASSAG